MYIYNDMIKWFDDQLEVASEERLHVEREGLLYMLISTKISAYETAKQHLWELNMLAEVKEEQEQSKEVNKNFYCNECSFFHLGTPCKPEDGAVIAFCPNCDEQRTFLYGNPSRKGGRDED